MPLSCRRRSGRRRTPARWCGRSRGRLVAPPPVTRTVGASPAEAGPAPDGAELWVVDVHVDEAGGATEPSVRSTTASAGCRARSCAKRASRRSPHRRRVRPPSSSARSPAPVNGSSGVSRIRRGTGSSGRVRLDRGGDALALEGAQQARGHAHRDRGWVFSTDLGKSDRCADPPDGLGRVAIVRQSMAEPGPLAGGPDQPDRAELSPRRNRITQRGVLRHDRES